MKNYKEIAVISVLAVVFLLVSAGLAWATTFTPTNQGHLLGSATMISHSLEKLIDNNPVEFIEGISSHLKIPTINVDALIESMGITQDGAMEAPSGAKNVGWYAFGPRPGDNGSAVIGGHYGYWNNGNVSVFNNLNKLIPGDKIYVENEEGMTTTFIVRKLQMYDKNDDASDIFISNDGKAHLNIITCAGVFDKVLKTYSNRLVIFSDKE